MQNKTKTNRLWTKNFILVCLMSLFMCLVTFSLDNVLAIYSSDVWDSESGGGLLTTTFTIGSILALALAGRVADKLGRKQVTVIGAASYIVGLAIMILTRIPSLNYFARFVQGIGKGCCGVGCGAIAADIIPKGRTGEGMGYFGLGSTLATAIGPSLGLFLISGGTYNFMFSVCIALYCVVLIILGLIRYQRDDIPPQPEEESAPQEANAPSEGRGIWKYFEPGALPSTLIAFCYGGGDVCVLIYLALYARQMLGIENSGIFYTVAAVAMVVLRLFIGKIVDRHGARGILIVGFSATIACYLLLLYGNGYYPLFLLAGVCYGASCALIYPAIQATTVIDSPKNHRGMANSTMTFGMDGGIMIFSAVFGVVLEQFSWTVMFFGSICICIVGLLLSILLMSNNRRAAWRAKLGVE